MSVAGLKVDIGVLFTARQLFPPSTKPVWSSDKRNLTEKDKTHNIQCNSKIANSARVNTADNDVVRLQIFSLKYPHFPVLCWLKIAD